MFKIGIIDGEDVEVGFGYVGYWDCRVYVIDFLWEWSLIRVSWLGFFIVI